jgi:hypothetical protein
MLASVTAGQLISEAHAVLSRRRCLSDIDGSNRQPKLFAAVVDASAKTNGIDKNFGRAHLVACSIG